MRFLANLLEHFGWIISGVLGFFVGLFALALGNLFGTYEWLVAIGIAVVAGLALLIYSSFDRGFDWLFDRGLNKVSKHLGTNTVEAEAVAANERYFRRLARIAYVVGVIVAFIAGSILSPAEIMSLLG